ncbi:hypothetical protein N9J84_01615 [Porticoccaceae bacterium]|nr:hypothetical protein [Porticoccaceae bacterium]
MSKDKNKDEGGAESVEDSFIVNVPLKFQPFHIPGVLYSIPAPSVKQSNIGAMSPTVPNFQDSHSIELGKLSDVILEGLCAKFRDGVFAMAARQRKDLEGD